MPTGVTDRRYWCFISYRHADNSEDGRQWANWIHHQLETYEVPDDLVGTPNGRGESIPKQIYPVFRDEEELGADDDLGAAIRAALQASRVLLVLCTPRATESRYVAQEIASFKEIGRAEHIIAAILEGEPGDAKIECFPEPLRHPLSAGGELDRSRVVEPIAADFRPMGETQMGWTSPGAYEEELQARGLAADAVNQRVEAYRERLELMRLKLVAGVLDVPLGVLTQRDRAHQLKLAQRRARVLRNWLLLVVGLVVLASVAAVVAWRQREAARDRTYTASIRAAAARFEAGDLGGARDALLETEHERRGWEWAFLLARCGFAPVQLTNLDDEAVRQLKSQAAQLHADGDYPGRGGIAGGARAGRHARQVNWDVLGMTGAMRARLDVVQGRTSALRMTTGTQGAFQPIAFFEDDGGLVIDVASAVGAVSAGPITHEKADLLGVNGLWAVPLFDFVIPASWESEPDALGGLVCTNPSFEPSPIDKLSDELASHLKLGLGFEGQLVKLRTRRSAFEVLFDPRGSVVSARTGLERIAAFQRLRGLVDWIEALPDAHVMESGSGTVPESLAVLWSANANVVAALATRTTSGHEALKLVVLRPEWEQPVVIPIKHTDWEFLTSLEHYGAGISLDASADGRYVALTCISKRRNDIVLADLEAREIIISPLDQSPLLLGWERGGSWCFRAERGGALTIMDKFGGTVIAELSMDARTRPLVELGAESPDGRLAKVGDRLWMREDWSPVFMLPTGTVISEDWGLVAMPAGEGLVEVVDVRFWTDPEGASEKLVRIQSGLDPLPRGYTSLDEWIVGNLERMPELLAQKEPARSAPATSESPEMPSRTPRELDRRPFEARHTVRVSTAAALSAALATAPDTPGLAIVLEPGDYSLATGLAVEGAKGISISSADPERPARLLAENPADQVVSFVDCENVELRDLVAGHGPGTAGHCFACVLSFNTCRDILISRCDLFGSGTHGVWLVACDGCDIVGTTIRDCTVGLVEIHATQGVLFLDSRLRSTDGGFTVYNSAVDLVRCVVEDNDAPGTLFTGWNGDVGLFDVDVKGNTARGLGDVYQSRCRLSGNTWE